MADDWHFSERLGKWLLLVRSEDNQFGWLDIIQAKLTGDKAGYRIKMRKDPKTTL